MRETTSIRLNDEERKLLDTFAERYGISRTEVLRAALDMFVRAEGHGEEPILLELQRAKQYVEIKRARRMSSMRLHIATFQVNVQRKVGKLLAEGANPELIAGWLHTEVRAEAVSCGLPLEWVDRTVKEVNLYGKRNEYRYVERSGGYALER